MTIDAILKPPTKSQINSALQFVLAVTEAIREAKQIPAGHLYALLCGKLDITAFDAMLRTVQNTGLVERRGDLLVWTGPELSGSRTDANRLHSGAATEAHTAQLSPRAEVEAIQADTRRIAEIREEMEADFADSPDGSRTLSASENSEEDDYDPEAMYDRRGRIVREDPDADYDAECKYAEVD